LCWFRQRTLGASVRAPVKARLLLHQLLAKGAMITADFVAHAARLGISPADCLALAHAQSSLPKTYSRPAAPQSAKATALAWTMGISTESPTATTRLRERARDVLARTVLRWWYADADARTPTECLASNGLDPAAFERLLHRVATAMPSLDQPMRTWALAASAVLSQCPLAGGARRTRNRLTSAGLANRSARAVAGLPTASASGPRPWLSTIHQAKGDQAEAVLLLRPTSQVTDPTLTAWLTGTAPDPEVAEALRVIYVGVTRARLLLGLAVPASDQVRLVAHLDRHGIPTELRSG
jgi:hypothetical protein